MGGCPGGLESDRRSDGGLPVRLCSVADLLGGCDGVQSFVLTVILLTVLVVFFGVYLSLVGVVGLRETRSKGGRGAGTIKASDTAATVDICSGRKGGRLGRMVDAQVMFVPLFAMAPEPAFGYGSDKTAARRQIDMFGRGMLLRSYVNNAFSQATKLQVD